MLLFIQSLGSVSDSLIHAFIHSFVEHSFGMPYYYGLLLQFNESERRKNYEKRGK